MACATSDASIARAQYGLRVAGNSPQQQQRQIGMYDDSDSDHEGMGAPMQQYAAEYAGDDGFDDVRAFDLNKATEAQAGYSLQRYEPENAMVPVALAKVLGSNVTSSNLMEDADGNRKMTTELVFEGAFSYADLMESTAKDGYCITMRPTSNVGEIFGMTPEEFAALPSDGTPTHWCTTLFVHDVENAFGDTLAINFPTVKSNYRRTKRNMKGIPHDVKVGFNETSSDKVHEVIVGVPDPRRDAWIQHYSGFTEANLRDNVVEIPGKDLVTLPYESPIVDFYNADMEDKGKFDEMIQPPNNQSGFVEMGKKFFDSYFEECIGYIDKLSNNFNPKNFEVKISLFDGDLYTPTPTEDNPKPTAGVPWFHPIDVRSSAFTQKCKLLKSTIGISSNLGKKVDPSKVEKKIAAVKSLSTDMTTDEMTKMRKISFTVVMEHMPMDKSTIGA